LNSVNSYGYFNIIGIVYFQVGVRGVLVVAIGPADFERILNLHQM